MTLVDLKEVTSRGKKETVLGGYAISPVAQAQARPICMHYVLPQYLSTVTPTPYRGFCFFFFCLFCRSLLDHLLCKINTLDGEGRRTFLAVHFSAKHTIA